MKIKLHFSGFLVIIASLLFERGEIVGLFFASALFHELGHLLAIRMLKKRVERIEIGAFGARIGIEDRLLGYGEELFIAIMGPLFNALSVAVIFFAFSASGIEPSEVIGRGITFLENDGGGIVEILGFVAISSIAQAFLNLLPIRTLDGGRMLYCIVSLLSGERAGERAIGISTAIVAFCVWTVALYLMLRAGAGLSLFVFAVWVFLGIAVKRGRED